VVSLILLKILLILLILFPLNLTAQHFEPLSKQDIILESVFVGLTCIDWYQTKKFRSEGRRETNKILGSEPSQERVDTLIFLGIVSHVAVAYFLSGEVRKFFTVSFIFIEAEAVWKNYNSEINYRKKDEEEKPVRIGFSVNIKI